MEVCFPSFFLHLHYDYLAIATTPTDVHLVRVSNKAVVLRWKYPAEGNDCGLYFVISGTIDGTSLQQIVDGSQREARFDNDAVHWTLRIAAANKLGTGPVSSPVHLNSGRHGRKTDLPPNLSFSKKYLV